MSYHLGTALVLDRKDGGVTKAIVPLKSYGFWQVSDPLIAEKLRAAGMQIPAVQASTGPIFVGVTDYSDGSLRLDIVSIERNLITWVPPEGRAQARAALEKTGSIPAVTSAEANRLVGREPRSGRMPIAPPPAELPPGASPPAAPPPAESPPAESPPIVLDPSLERAIDRAVGRKSSNTGLYIGVGAAAVLLLVGLGAFRKGG